MIRKCLIGLFLLIAAAAPQAAQAQAPQYPTNWRWVVGDQSAPNNIWNGVTGALESNASADYLAWVGQLAPTGGLPSPTQSPYASSISGSASNGGPNLIRLTVNNTISLATGNVMVVANNGPVSNGTWTITVIDAACNSNCRVDLQGSTFSGSSESGGILSEGTPTATMAGLLAFINSQNEMLPLPQYLPLTLTADVQLTNPLPTWIDITGGTTGNHIIYLPQANIFGSVPLGVPIRFNNKSGYTITIKTGSFSGGPVASTVLPILPGSSARIALAQNGGGTLGPNGNWSFDAPTTINTGGLSAGMMAIAQNNINGIPIWQAVTPSGDCVPSALGVFTCTKPAYFSAYLSSQQTPVTSGVITKITFQTKDFDSNTWYDATTNYRFTPLVAGKYRIHVMVTCDGTTVTACEAYVYKNGSAYAQSYVPLTANAALANSVDIIVSFNGSTDYVEGFGQNTCTGTCSFQAGPTPRFTWFEAHFISP